MKKNFEHVVSVPMMIALVLLVFIFGAPSSVHAASPFQNGGFETGNLSGWNVVSTMSVSAQYAHGGMYGVGFTNTGNIRQTFATSTGQTYTVLAWVRIDKVTTKPTSGGLQVIVTDNGRTLGQQTVGTTVTGVWTAINFSFVARSSQSRISFSNSSDGTFNASGDDFSVTKAGTIPPVPSATPSTITPIKTATAMNTATRTAAPINTSTSVPTRTLTTTSTPTKTPMVVPTNTSTPLPTQTKTVSPTVTRTPTPITGPTRVVQTVLAINAGGSTIGSFVADTNCSGGNTYSTSTIIDTSGVPNPVPMAVYQTERWGTFTYTLPGFTPGATYAVRLHFAEVYFTVAGKRQFNVSINGTQVLTNFDIVADIGAANKADIKQFSATANASGQITVGFTGGALDNPKVNGIEVVSSNGTPLPTSTVTNTPTRTSTPATTSTPINTPINTPIATPFPPGPAGSDWPMAAANPQRTSHNSVEVRGNLNVEWYHVIDPYVDTKIQVIAAAGKVFLSTSKGLYAFDATSGTQLWAFGTELPPGNAPTYYNGVVYLPGFDHIIRALDASAGTEISGYVPYEAGSGFETNPLIVNNTIYAGNRDGYLYALNATTGALKWKYQASGVIRFSAALSNDGTRVYFASDDAYGYALDAASGTLKWKSPQLPGVGFATYWPVVWRDPVSGKEYVIFSSSEKASAYNWMGANTDYFQSNYDINASCASSSTSYVWAAGTQVLDCSPIFNYLNNTRPDRRNFIVLDAAQGTEYKPYAPVNWAGVSQGGNKFPPVVGGDGVLYTTVGFSTGGNGGAGAWITGLKFGTQFVSQIWNDHGAGDEPPAFTSGGNLIYWGEGVNHEAWGTVDISKPAGSNYYSWADPRTVAGAKSKYFTNPVSPDLWLSARFGSFTNGVYGYYDGVSAQSPIPYNGRLYLVNGNVLYAMSPTGGARQLPTVVAPTTLARANVTLSVTAVNQKLTDEIQKIVNAGHLRPGFFDSAYVGRGLGQNYIYNTGAAKTSVVAGNGLEQYFHTPGETLYTLSQALPYLSPTLQSQVRAFLQNEQTRYPVESIADIGWENGALREAYPDTPELAAIFKSTSGNSSIAGQPRTSIFYLGCCDTHVNIGNFPADAPYSAWKYVQAMGFSQAQALTLFNAIKPKLQVAAQTDMNDTNMLLWPYILNQYIAGYNGYIELQKMAGQTPDANVVTEYNRLLSLRVNNFSKDSPFANYPVSGYNDNYVLNVARNFMYLTPELANAMNVSAVQTALNEYQTLAPYWFVPKYERTYEEGVGQPLWDRHALFQARAYILKQPFSELVKYLDEPAFATGDLFYIQNLVALLKSAGTVPSQPTPTSMPIRTSTPTAMPSATPTRTNTPTVVATSTPIRTSTPIATPTAAPTSSGAMISNVTVNSAQVAQYDKLEITFQVNTVATNLNMPYDVAPPAGVTPKMGITVDGEFSQDNFATVLRQPGFIYQDFDYQIKNNQEWMYPKGLAWKVRFAPTQAGNWQFRLRATDAGGSAVTTPQAFSVTSPTNPGFVKVSADPRYFEFNNGTYAPMLGYNMNYNQVDWSNPVQNNTVNFQKMGQNGIQLTRIWLSQWSIWGSSWNPWYSIRNDYDNYIPRAGLSTLPSIPNNPQAVMVLRYNDNNSGNYYDACRFLASFQPAAAVLRNTNYHIKVHYYSEGIAGPRNATFPNYGLVAKVQNPNDGNWHTQCYNGGSPQNGVPVTSYGHDTSGGWATVEGDWNSGNTDFLPIFYLAAENLNPSPWIAIDRVEITDPQGVNILAKPTMNYLEYFSQRNSYAFDKVVDLAHQNGVYLRPVIMEKGEQIENEIDYNGRLATYDNNNFYGNYRTVTSVRWYQQAWWRYLQARWGYSPNIQSWELLNEGDPVNSRHFTLADEFAKYMHQFADRHLVSTSTWNIAPANTFWGLPDYQNIDFMDVHSYIPKDANSTEFYDTALADYNTSTWYGAKSGGGANKPVIRGETGLTNSGTEPATNDVNGNSIWLHDFLWAQLNPGGMIESYWYANMHIYSSSFDFRNEFGNLSKYLKDIPLNNGRYVDAQATAQTGLRVWGQKDLTNQKAHLWIANASHTWNATGQPVSGSIVLSGFQPNRSFTVEWWNTYTGIVSSTQSVTTDSFGNLVLSVSNLATDTAVKIK